MNKLNLQFKLNRSSASEIEEHLERNNHSFFPVLSDQVDIHQYAVKLYKNAYRFELWDKASMVGLVACYLNDKITGIAFITNVSVDREWQSLGIATFLLKKCLNHAKKLGFEMIKLEVNKKNTAKRLYVRMGFLLDEVSKDKLIMSLKF